MVGAFAVAAAAVLAWDQTGLLPTVAGPARVAGVVYERGVAGSGQGFDALQRLRLPEAPPAEGSSAPVELAAAAFSEPVPAPAAGEVAVAPAPEKFDAPPPPPARPPAQLRRSQFDGVQPSGGTWAVMIGINDYPGTRYDLRSAVADVEDVNEALGRMGVPGGNRLLIRDGQATAGTIRAAADWLRAHAGPDAVAVFFYAGHVRKVGGDTEAMVGSDGATVTDRELAQILDGMQARRAWIGMAACYGGGFTEVLKPGRILTAAASADDLAYENERLGRSYLVEYMVRRAMIQNKASASVEAAFAWARAEIARDYPQRVPVQFDHDPGELDLRPPKPSGSPPPPPPPSGGSAPSGSGGSGGPSPDATQPAPKPDDGCAQITIGVVRCGGS